MARFKGKDLYLKDDDQVYFGNNQEAALWYDGNDLRLDHTISGTPAVQPYHLIQKQQVEDYVISVTSGVAYFTDLLDTPGIYPPPATGTEYIVPVLNPAGDGLVFDTIPLIDEFTDLIDTPYIYPPPASGVEQIVPMLNASGTGLIFDTIKIPPSLYDEDRDKWITQARPVLAYGKEGPADDLYLGVAGVSSHAGYYIYNDALITGIYCRSSSGNVNKSFDIITVVSGIETVVHSFNYDGVTQLYVDETTDVDIPAGAVLRVYVSKEGFKVEDTICQIEIAWRVDPEE